MGVTRRPRLLDLCCNAGGASMGYHRAGFDVVGVDIDPQPNYPFEFHQADAMTYPLDGFDAVHASPPCQRYTRLARRAGTADDWPDLLGPMLARLAALDVPWVVENVPDSGLVNAVQLCGSSFGLNLRRHRLFASNLLLLCPPCDHAWQTPRFYALNGDTRRTGRLAPVVGVYGHVNYEGEAELRNAAMGIDWMTQAELVEAIPPAYTEHIGRQLLAALAPTG